MMHCLANSSLSGPVNVTAPNPVSNAEFTRALGKALHRPTFLPAPAFALRLIFGDEMANDTVLASQRVRPAKLEASGFQFRYAEVGAALEGMLRSED
jgi:NAD dependent epimerase/dehydratase family enzyme